MHHRLRKEVHRKLKHEAVDRGCAVTDLVNEGIALFLERIDKPAKLKGELKPDVDFVDALRSAKRDGTFFESVSPLTKDQLVTVLDLLGRHSDRRSSRDRLIAVLAYELQASRKRA